MWSDVSNILLDGYKGVTSDKIVQKLVIVIIT